MGNMLTTTEAAAYAGVTSATIIRWIKQGYFGNAASQNVSRGSGCGYRIHEADLEKYLHR